MQAYRRPTSWRLVGISAVAAAVSLVGGIAILSLAGDTTSPAKPDHPAAPPFVASFTIGAGPPVMAIRDADGVVALVAIENPAGSDHAVVSGRVERLSGVCVGITKVDGSGAIVVWPAGTTFSEDSLGLRVPGYGALTYGSQLTTGGGFATIDDLGFRAELPEDCDAAVVAFITAKTELAQNELGRDQPGAPSPSP